MKIIIIGCSRLGASLANLLAAQGHEVSVIDPKAEALERLDHDFPGQTFIGVGIDLELLASAGAGKADVLIAVTDRDSANLVAAQVARGKFHIPMVIARAYDPRAAAAYRSMGLNIFCPTEAGIDYVQELLQGGGEQ
ncbi:Glutathione-regulated potassium-efflux system protein KefC [Neomoorella glycerini]|uniref:Glutathione-regulated potassium-efflux system protein KefC n=1 Tax=Neomoorella glycerini TaxID=55779 RepID=A0A6I5ZW93_9FIRM|nr:TrkA family potassium uptake protein [Moorella glycerini]QGP93727.1 Glutathione-regulated potassium-efflux system protein KefC [Moorella glycerini]